MNCFLCMCCVMLKLTFQVSSSIKLSELEGSMPSSTCVQNTILINLATFSVLRTSWFGIRFFFLLCFVSFQFHGWRLSAYQNFKPKTLGNGHGHHHRNVYSKFEYRRDASTKSCLFSLFLSLTIAFIPILL